MCWPCEVRSGQRHHAVDLRKDTDSDEEMGKDGVEWISSSCRGYLMNAKRHSLTKHCIIVNVVENVDLIISHTNS